MLKTWSVHHFKAIMNSGDLHLSPVTVITGLNSSGKTSLLQSILMVGQTLANRLTDRALLPNERIVQLGTFEDLTFPSDLEKRPDHSLQIDFAVDLDSFIEEEMFPFDENGEALIAVQHDQYTIQMSVVFRRQMQSLPFSALDDSKVEVESAQITVLRTQIAPLASKAPLPLHFSYHAMTEEERNQFLLHIRPDQRSLIPQNGESPSYVGTFSRGTKKDSSVYAVGLSHFLPTTLIRKFKERERIEEEIETEVAQLLTLHRSLHQRFQQITLSTAIPDSLHQSIQYLIQQHGVSHPFTGTTLSDLGAWSRIVGEHEEKAFQQMLSTLIMTVTRSLLALQIDEQSELLVPVGWEGYADTNELLEAVNLLSTYFSRGVRYLGPLRADPNTIQQQFAPTGNVDDVGNKGEYAATVYHYNRQTRLSYYNPEREAIVEDVTLQEALDTWTRYLDIADHVSTDVAGASGMTWKVFLKPNQAPRPLWQVGVGTSQILPLLVMGLLSPKESLLVIEQPELHLHPRIQARLGDFFLGLAACGKQCLIETHSENLINQLRYHIVQAGGQDNSQCALYFAEQDAQGRTTFHPVHITARGNIDNWPDGFFDETLLQQERIAEANLRHQMKEK